MSCRVAGYVKLAKLWERSRDSAIAYNEQYYRDKFHSSDVFELQGVYIDITGKKEIKNRPEMLRLIRDCQSGKIDCIAAQTRAYLAANAGEFCYLIRYLFDMSPPIHIVTEDEEYNINTLVNSENQREELYRMASNYIALRPDAYVKWREDICNGMQKYLD